ncbi:AraC family transcriptional regulator [Algibacter lectus]|uniref:Transcriptional regulator n=1 Tax=Algibacter lectus TaxID=221126 RepID=A0A090X1C4_9FLAO|nr:AraC family transcriptional regulator [Algibacter lectus]GAL64758.1 transcriptional regulator [Algibacter lectus]GAL81719.1 transcriptional regulator [Algibacter lectus]SFD26721.1 AraC-type DNA-binding protein [Algibacter lectus]
MKSIKEITPIKQDDPFVILKHENALFDYPLHFHNEYELNLITNFKGSRTTGDYVETLEGDDLTLLGPELKHVWKSDNAISNTGVITIQFQEHFLHSKIMSYNVSKDIKKLLELSKRGISFSDPTKKKVSEMMLSIDNNNNFKSFLTFLEILHTLSISKDIKVLSSPPSANYSQQRESRRISLILNYVKNNYQKNIKLSQVAEMVNMSESAFSHYFKKRTSHSFTSYLQDYRLGVVTKLLTETNMSINEISYSAGFNSLSNFNRAFKKKHNISPKTFKLNYDKEVSR